MSHPDILILVGTQTGNSEVVAEVVAEELGEAGFTCHVVDMAEACPEMLAGYRQLVVVMCTWAEGTFPDNTVEFYDALVAVKPDLSELSFGMIGLGGEDAHVFGLGFGHPPGAVMRQTPLDRGGAFGRAVKRL